MGRSLPAPLRGACCLVSMCRAVFVPLRGGRARGGARLGVRLVVYSGRRGRGGWRGRQAVGA
eukprot:2882948-Pleurochrysis_carterae.AAC.1